MPNRRRAAAMICSVFVGIFVTALAMTSEPLGARECQQYCDARYGEGMMWCNYAYSYPSAEWDVCYQSVYGEWQSCSMDAISCIGEWTCWLEGFLAGVPIIDCARQ